MVILRNNLSTIFKNVSAMYIFGGSKANFEKSEIKANIVLDEEVLGVMEEANRFLEIASDEPGSRGVLTQKTALEHSRLNRLEWKEWTGAGGQSMTLMNELLEHVMRRSQDVPKVTELHQVGTRGCTTLESSPKA